jgi:hypothetical protein
MDSLDPRYEEWCKKIAKSRELSDLISHFREHVGQHYDRHNREGKLGMDVWLVGVLNFMHILEKKYPYITGEDMLFKLCTYHKNHPGGPDAPFDAEGFIEQYNGEIKKFHRSR